MVLAALPAEALPPPFDPGAWREAVKSAASPADLRRALGRLEEGLHNDYVSPAFHRRPLLVKGAWLPTGLSSCLSGGPLRVWWWVVGAVQVIDVPGQGITPGLGVRSRLQGWL